MKDKRALKISVYAIMKDEEQFFDRWVASMWDEGNGADEICILDTGSKNGWMDLLYEAADKVNMPRENFVFSQKIYSPWRFDAARNDSMNLVSDVTDICICTDLDEVLVSGWGKELRRVVEETPDAGEVFYYYAWSSDEKTGEAKRYFPYNKCHRHPKFGVEWKYPVHETLVYTDEYKKMFPNTARMSSEKIWLWHYPDQTKSRGNYLGLLELRAQEYPEDKYGLFYLAREYQFRGMYDKTIQWGSYLLSKLKIEKIDDMLMEPALYVLLGESYDKIGANDDCEFCYQESIKLHPTYRDAYVRLAQKLAYMNRPAECFEVLKQMEENSVRVYDWRNVDFMWRDWKIHQIKADALMWMGRHNEAAVEMFVAIGDIKTPQDIAEAKQENFYEDAKFLQKALKEIEGADCQPTNPKE